MKSINLMKNVGRFTPPQNRQVRLTLKSSVQFTLKSSLAIYPPSPLPPKIAKSDLPSNRLYDLPSNRLWRFTHPQKSPCPTYPQIVFGDLLPFKCEVFEYIVLNIKNS